MSEPYLLREAPRPRRRHRRYAWWLWPALVAPAAFIATGAYLWAWDLNVVAGLPLIVMGVLSTQGLILLADSRRDE